MLCAPRLGLDSFPVLAYLVCTLRLLSNFSTVGSLVHLMLQRKPTGVPLTLHCRVSMHSKVHALQHMLYTLYSLARPAQMQPIDLTVELTTS